jgi:hypothetical protein
MTGANHAAQADAPEMHPANTSALVSSSENSCHSGIPNSKRRPGRNGCLTLCSEIKK